MYPLFNSVLWLRYHVWHPAMFDISSINSSSINVGHSLNPVHPEQRLQCHFMKPACTWAWRCFFCILLCFLILLFIFWWGGVVFNYKNKKTLWT